MDLKKEEFIEVKYDPVFHCIESVQPILIKPRKASSYMDSHGWFVCYLPRGDPAYVSYQWFDDKDDLANKAEYLYRKYAHIPHGKIWWEKWE